MNNSLKNPWFVGFGTLLLLSLLGVHPVLSALVAFGAFMYVRYSNKALPK